MAYFLLLMAGSASALATLLLRRAGMVSAQQQLLGVPVAWGLTGSALVAYGVGFIAYALALKAVPANLAYPVMTGITLLLILAAGLLWLGESLSPRLLAGAVLLLLGIYLIGAR